MAMYREGSSLSAIGRVFGVSAQAVSVWVKRGGRAARSRMGPASSAWSAKCARGAPRGPGWGGGADSGAKALPAFRRQR